MFKYFDKNKTFRPKKSFAKGTRRYELHKYAKATLGSGNLRAAVQTPKGEDLNEWLAVNTVDFFNQINLLYGSIVDFCTQESCPVMCAGTKYEYLWADNAAKKPIKVSAPEYVNLLMNWIQEQLDDETIFPSRTDVPFPKTFQATIKNIFKRLFRVYAHIYYSHFQKIVSLAEEAHLNTCFKHFYYFVDEFRLIDKKELAPLQELIDNLTEKDGNNLNLKNEEKKK
jgi:MOB kinase activator 1